MMTSGDPMTGPLNLRQLWPVRPPDDYRDRLIDLQQIHAVTRQVSGWVCTTSVNSPVTLERLLASEVRQIQADQNLQPRLTACYVDVDVQSASANFCIHLESVRAMVACQPSAK